MLTSRMEPGPLNAESPVQFLWRQTSSRRVAFAGWLALVTGGAACAVGVQYSMKLIVDSMAGGDMGRRHVWWWLVLFMGLIAVESVFWRLSGWLGCNTVVATGVNIRLALFRHLAGHSANFFSTHLSGSLGNRINATAAAAGSVYSALIWRIVPPTTDFVGAVVVALLIDARMAVTLVAFVAAVAVLITFVGVRGRPLHQAYAEKSAGVGGELVDVVANMWNVKAFSAGKREYLRLSASLDTEAAAHRRSWLYLEKTRLVHDICLFGMAATMLTWAIHSWTAGRVSAGDVVVLSALTFRILHGSRDLALALVECSQQLGVIREMLGVVSQPHSVTDTENAAELRVTSAEIRLEKLQFRYDETSPTPVLDALELHIPPGQRIGIVGPSGAGKSTLVALLQRLADPQGGRIAINGQDIAGLTQDSLRNAIAVVPQEVLLFHRSVLENIRFGRPEASNEEVFRAARNANCDVFIHALPLGYDTVVGERGSRLSGGQRQRIGIARALLKDAPILILDEATSALDSASEAEIQLALDGLMQGRTVIAVAHRLATVIGFDRIVVLRNGRLVEDGTPAQLRGSGGVFAAMWKLQSEGMETE
jgi:ATP-binding cassette subfamily B protein